MDDSTGQSTTLNPRHRAADVANPPHLIAYARISDLSTKRQTRANVLGVQAQHSACTVMADDIGAIVIKRYTDNDRSASRGDHRPGFEAMIADLHRGHTADGAPVHGVIAVDVDRIYKTPTQWERFVTALRATSGRVLVDSLGPRDLYAPDSDETEMQDLSVVMGENRRRRDRTKRWHAAQGQRGIAHTGGRTFGYRPVSGTTAIEVVAEEAAVIRDAVAACIAGETWGAITRIFASSGIPTANGGPWRTQTVKQIISNPRLAGLRILDGGIVTDRTGVPVLGRWEPIITPVDWEAVCRRHAPRRRTSGRPNTDDQARMPRKYLLSGFLRCGRQVDGRLCGCVLQGCATKVGQSAHRYACRPKSDGGCGGVSVHGEWMDREVADLVLDVLTAAPSDALKQPPWGRAPELGAISARRDELRARLPRGGAAEASMRQRGLALDEILQDLLQEKEAWEAVEACLNDGAPERLRRWSARPDDGGYDLRQRRALITSVLISVLVFPSGRGRMRQPKHGYLPILNRSLVVPNLP